jgi:hypothetical protein
MRFPTRDFTYQYISRSYQDVIQQYIPDNTFYILDGYGNVILSFPSASVGSGIITSDMTSSMSVASSSYFFTQSYQLIIVSSSFASSSISASFSNLSVSSSYALSASWAPTPTVSNSSSSFASSSVSSSYSLLSTSSSFSLNSLSSSYSITSSVVIYTQITSSNAETCDFALLSGDAITATSCSYAQTASFVWHLPPPVSSSDFGIDGWQSYDQNYYYVYTNGMWKRSSLLPF